MFALFKDIIVVAKVVFLGLDDLFEAIIEVTNEIIANDKKRMNDKAADTKKGIVLRSAAYKDIT